MEDGSVKALQKVKITLADCLACSGCVTTAESVLVEAQSVAELIRVLQRTESKPKLVVVSISPQTLASLAATCFLSMTQVYFRLNTLFRRYFGVHYVFDIVHAREVALVESAVEFVQRFRVSEKGPVLASACPGWICYAEKNSGSQDVLQHISTVKSPQQVMGALVKRKLSELHPGVTPSDIYHIAMMPCFDKKLEASRTDFYSDAYRSHDVDLVLTSMEVPGLLAEAGLSDFSQSLEETPIEPGLFNSLDRDAETGELKVCGVSGPSGSFAEFIFKHASKELFEENVAVPIELKTLARPKGVKEVRLEREGKTLLAFATAYGFSNIANVVKQTKQGTSKYHYIEVMACPSGCVNGGGQLRLDSMPSSSPATHMEVDQDSSTPIQEEVVTRREKPTTARELLAAVERVFASDQIVHLDPFNNPIIQNLYANLGCEPGDEKARSMFHTTYHAMAMVEAKKNPLTIQW